MFPLNWNIPFIRKNGSRTTLGAITGDIAGIEEDVAGLNEKTDGLTEEVKDIHTLSSKAGTVFDLTIKGGAGGDNGTRALVFGSTFIGWLSYYSNQWNLSILTKVSGQTVTASNNNSNGLRITFTNGDTVNILPVNLGGSNFTITHVS